MEPDSRPVLVGEANPYGADPKYALFPMPMNSAGGRLCFKVLGMEMRDYLAAFDRVNLCPQAWSKYQASEHAVKLACQKRPLVLLGSKVCSAFGTPYTPFESRDLVLVLPHPSGLCRAWNVEGSYERARDSVKGLLPSVAHLLGRRDP